MISKVALVVLVGCAYVFAAPANSSPEASPQGTRETFEQSPYGKLLFKMVKAFNKADETVKIALDTPDYRDAQATFTRIQMKTHNGFQLKLEGDAKERFEAEVPKVDEALDVLLAEAKAGTADIPKFKKSVEALENVVETLTSKT